MNEHLIKILLLHAEYSFACVNWEFNQLTDREKDLIGSQKTLNQIRRIAEDRTGLGTNGPLNYEYGEEPLFI